MEASQSSIAMVPARCTAETQSSRATVAFKIAGYSLHKGLGRGKYLCSPAFSVGGYEWCIRYYPDGSRDETSQGHVSVFLKLLTKNAKVRARHNWMLVDPLSGRSIVVLFGGEPHVFDHESPSWGLRRFMKTTAEEESANVCNDCLVIECEVTVIKDTFDVHVPPSDLSDNLATLLEGEKGADVTFKVQGEVFSAHKVLVRDPNRGESLLSAGKHMDKEKNEDVDANKNKKPRIDASPRRAMEEKSEKEQTGGKKEQIQESQESIESDVSLHTSLLIDSMAMEFMEDEKLVSVNCSDDDMNKKMRSPVSEKKSFADVVRITPQVVSVDVERGECDAGKVEYMVESPDNAVEVEVIPTPPLATEENLRFSLRNVQSKMEDVQLKAAAVVKKRNAEGTLHSHNSFDALSNQNMMLVASKMGVIIPDNDFVNIDIIRELEKLRNNNSRVEREDEVEAEEDFNNMSVINANGVVTPLELGWMEEGNIIVKETGNS
ncbi:BTB/POZ and MATH domain-containing protein 1 [Hordeum vulgare]|nr:BTB/POZ and MATH domain-containing protein 1 [Hordeum vulgare]